MPFCRAPTTNLRIDADGQVRACGPSPVVLGDLRGQRLLDAWNGSARTDLAGAVADRDLSLGCGPCAARLLRDDPDAPPRAHRAAPCADGPSTLELVLEPSSGPEQGFDDDLFADLDALLPRLGHLRIDGCPDEVPVGHKVWELLAAHDHPPRCHVTLCGTLPSPELQRLMAKGLVDVSVRVVGPTASEPSPGGDLGPLAVAERTCQQVADAGGEARLAFELRRESWPELGELLLVAERWGVDVDVSFDRSRPSSRLDTLPPAALAEVVASLERQCTSLLPRLQRSRKTFEWAVETVRHALEEERRRTSEDEHATEMHLASAFARVAAPELGGSGPDTGTARLLPERAGDLLTGTIRFDLDDRATAASPGFLGIPGPDLVGRSFFEVGLAIDALLGVGGSSWVERHDERTHLRWEAHYPSIPTPTVLRAVTVAERSDDGSLVGTYTRAAVRREEADGHPS